MSPAKLHLDLAAPRVATGLVAWPCGGVHHHVLVAAFYGFADSAERTYAAFEELHLALQTYGGHFIIAGDFNITQDEGPISAALAEGTLRAADDAAHASLPATSPAAIRRIDFALHHPSLFTLKVVTERRAPLSDHALVAYDYGDNLYPPMWRAPRFPDQSSFTIFTEEQELLLDAAEPDITEFLHHSQTEAAWVALSDLAEALMGAHAGDHKRSDLWEPISQSRRPTKPALCGHESPGLQALRRLTQRLHQLMQQPWRRDLCQATARSLKGARVKVPELPYVDLQHPARALATVAELEQTFRQQEREVRLERWKHSVRDSIDSAIAWVKRRADKAMRLQAAVDPVTTQIRYVHPAAKVEDQGEHCHPTSRLSMRSSTGCVTVRLATSTSHRRLQSCRKRCGKCARKPQALMAGLPPRC